MKKIIKSALLAANTLALSATSALAAVEGPLGPAGSPPEETDAFGTIEAPQGVAAYGSLAEGGLLLFVSNIIRLSTVVAGIWVMFNFILAGWKYITSAGDSKAPSEAASMMNNSLIGLAIIVGAYTIAAIIGLVFFGDPSYIINPQITGVATQ